MHPPVHVPPTGHPTGHPGTSVSPFPGPPTLPQTGPDQYLLIGSGLAIVALGLTIRLLFRDKVRMRRLLRSYDPQHSDSTPAS